MSERVEEFDEYPFGRTAYKNYDPENINTVEDVVGLFEWLCEENRAKGEMGSGAVYEDCARVLRNELLEEQ